MCGDSRELNLPDFLEGHVTDGSPGIRGCSPGLRTLQWATRRHGSKQQLLSLTYLPSD